MSESEWWRLTLRSSCDVRRCRCLFLFQLREEFAALSAELRELDPESPCEKYIETSSSGGRRLGR